MNHKCLKIFIALLVFVMPVSLYAQNAFKVTGRVYDAQTKEPIIGSAIGYKSVEMLISKRGVINFPLETDAESLEDAVVVGYGTQKKATITGSLTTANITDIARSTAPSLSNSIGGIIPGIITRQASGEPGNDGAILQIRGLGTWVNANPLVLVDGVERDLNQVNTEEIESFSILKDASATAVYGMRGANGVILITTKKGKVGRPQVSFRTEMTNLHGLRFPDYIEGYEFANSMYLETLTSR